MARVYNPCRKFWDTYIPVLTSMHHVIFYPPSPLNNVASWWKKKKTLAFFFNIVMGAQGVIRNDCFAYKHRLLK